MRVRRRVRVGVRVRLRVRVRVRVTCAAALHGRGQARLELLQEAGGLGVQLARLEEDGAVELGDRELQRLERRRDLGHQGWGEGEGAGAGEGEGWG